MLGVLFQLEVEYTDGTKETINSNESWKCSTGPVTKSGIYYGEAYDAGWNKDSGPKLNSRMNPGKPLLI